MTDDEVLRYAMIEKRRAQAYQEEEDDRRDAAETNEAAREAMTRASDQPGSGPLTGRHRSVWSLVRPYWILGAVAAVLLGAALFGYFQRVHAASP